METKFWQLHKGQDEAIFREAGNLLRQGELVAFPTETVYGLGANGLDGGAVKKIYAAKGRPSDNPLILHIAELGQLEQLAAEITPMARKLAEKFWPGPMTLVVKKSAVVPDEVSALLDTVAVRFPSNKDACALIRAAGVPIAAPSANLSGKPSPTTAEDVAEDMAGRIGAILDGGACSVGVESTVLDTTGEVPVILRPGGITPEMVQEVIGSVALDPVLQGATTLQPRAPGMKYRHYAPKARVVLCADAADLQAKLVADKGSREKIGIIAPRSYEGYQNRVYGSVAEFTNKLFQYLRDLDRQEVQVIYAQVVPEEGLGLAVMNRLKKAARG